MSKSLSELRLALQTETAFNSNISRREVITFEMVKYLSYLSNDITLFEKEDISIIERYINYLSAHQLNATTMSDNEAKTLGLLFDVLLQTINEEKYRPRLVQLCSQMLQSVDNTLFFIQGKQLMLWACQTNTLSIVLEKMPLLTNDANNAAFQESIQQLANDLNQDEATKKTLINTLETLFYSSDHSKFCAESFKEKLESVWEAYNKKHEKQGNAACNTITHHELLSLIGNLLSDSQYVTQFQAVLQHGPTVKRIMQSPQLLCRLSEQKKTTSTRSIISTISRLRHTDYSFAQDLVNAFNAFFPATSDERTACLATLAKGLIHLTEAQQTQILYQLQTDNNKFGKTLSEMVNAEKIACYHDTELQKGLEALLIQQEPATAAQHLADAFKGFRPGITDASAIERQRKMFMLLFHDVSATEAENNAEQLAKIILVSNRTGFLSTLIKPIDSLAPAHRAKLVKHVIRHINHDENNTNKIIDWINNQISIIHLETTHNNQAIELLLPTLFGDENFKILMHLYTANVTKSHAEISASITRSILALFKQHYTSTLHDAFYTARRSKDWEDLTRIVTQKDWGTYTAAELDPNLYQKQQEDCREKNYQTALLEKSRWRARYELLEATDPTRWNWWRTLGTYLGLVKLPEPSYKNNPNIILDAPLLPEFAAVAHASISDKLFACCKEQIIHPEEQEEYPNVNETIQQYRSNPRDYILHTSINDMPVLVSLFHALSTVEKLQFMRHLMTGESAAYRIENFWVQLSQESSHNLNKDKQLFFDHLTHDQREQLLSGLTQKKFHPQAAHPEEKNTTSYFIHTEEHIRAHAELLKFMPQPSTTYLAEDEHEQQYRAIR